MRLTADLVALCHREVAEQPPDPRYDYFDDADFEAALGWLMKSRPPGPLWVFAYGSLIWKPEFEVTEKRRVVARGWQRGFSMRIDNYRGTPDQPGYMMCLDPGGDCEGLALRVEEEKVEAAIRKLLYREIGGCEGLEAARWIDCETAEGPIRALTFYARPDRLDIYAANRPLDEVVHGLARACGHWGSGAEYLRNTVIHLEELGIHDEGLWRLQELVAAEIEALYELERREPRG